MKRTRTLKFSASCYSLEAVKRAAYRFSDLVSPFINLEQDQICCELSALDKCSDDEFDRVCLEFPTEVLDQDLRQKVSAETEAARNAVLAYAFSKSGLQDEQ